MRLTLQVVVSVALVAAVLWFMWRLPRAGERWRAVAPPLALACAWAGLASLLLTALLWVLPWPDLWLVVTFLVLYPAALASGVLVHWVHRGDDSLEAAIDAQLLQAKVGLVLGLVAVALGYLYVMTHKTPFT